MKATLSSKGQITIPLALRNRLNLKTGDQLEFEEDALILTAKRVVDLEKWDKSFEALRAFANKSLEGHPWQKMSSSEMIDDMRGGSVEKDIPTP